MKAALIPPKGLEAYMYKTKFQLFLAQELLTNKNYIAAALTAKKLGSYTIVDNGAFEGRLVPSSELVTVAALVKADEVVLPDVLMRTGASITASIKFLNDYPELKTSFMAVAQGTRISNFKTCVEAFAEYRRIKVIGLPKHILTTVDPSARIDLAVWINDAYPNRFDVHFLGTNPVWLGEIKSAAKYSPTRSVDSSVPFYYSLAGKTLGTVDRPTTVKCERSPHYFTHEHNIQMCTISLDANVQTYLGWASTKALA